MTCLPVASGMQTLIHQGDIMVLSCCRTHCGHQCLHQVWKYSNTVKAHWMILCSDQATLPTLNAATNLKLPVRLYNSSRQTDCLLSLSRMIIAHIKKNITVAVTITSAYTRLMAARFCGPCTYSIKRAVTFHSKMQASDHIQVVCHCHQSNPHGWLLDVNLFASAASKHTHEPHL